MYILQLFDNYAATYSLLVIGLVESLALAWVYGELTVTFQGKNGQRGGKPLAQFQEFYMHKE